MKPTIPLIAALAALLVAGCSSSTGSTTHENAAGTAAPSVTQPAAPEAQPAAQGVEAATDTIPWSKVGPGWLLSTWSPVPGTRGGEDVQPNQPTRETSTTTLYLVDPAGGRYPITTFPPPGEQVGPELVDWSGDGSKALFYATEYPGPSKAIVVDLHTGAKSEFVVDGTPRFTQPQGKAVLLSNPSGPNSKPGTLERVDLTGNRQLTYPIDKLDSTFSGRYLSTPDGTQLVLGTASGLLLMGNDGTVGKPISIPGQKDCDPLRWWDGANTVLASCRLDDGSYKTQLWRVPVDGARAQALTAPNDGSGDGPDLSDLNAWQLPSGTFVQAAGGCGVIYLAKLNDDGTTTPVSVPEAEKGKSIQVLGADGSTLDLQVEAACGGGQAVLRYDPAANTSTTLLAPPVNGGGVIATVPYGGRR
jgi:hypothetical protein